MAAVNAWSSHTFNTTSQHASSARLKTDVDNPKFSKERTNSPNQADPACTVEISDKARAMNSQRTSNVNDKNNGVNTPAVTSLFTQVGRTETAKRYDQVFANFLADYNEAEALQRFDEFMRSEGYVSTASSATASLSKKMLTNESNLYSHSYLETNIIDGKEHILASTWATYSAPSATGNYIYQKKISDSFDIAANVTAIKKGKSLYSMLMDKEGYESQINEFMDKIDRLLAEASTTGDLIDSTVTEEEIINSLKSAEDKFKGNITAKLTLESIEKEPESSSDVSSQKSNSEERWAYIDDKGEVIMATVTELKSKFKAINNDHQPDQTKKQSDQMKKMMDFIASLK